MLPLGQLESLAIPGESYQLAFTPGLLAQVFQRSLQGQTPEELIPNPAEILGGKGGARGGYVDLDGNGYWWIPSGRIFHSPESEDAPEQELAYARQHFFLPHRSRDPFHTAEVSTESFITYDNYDLLVLSTRDPLGNQVTVGERDLDGNLTVLGNDYRVLQPRLMMDPNRNRTAVAFDALGMVVGTAIMGKPEESLGDLLTDFQADLSDSDIIDHLANPLIAPHSILQRATTRLIYDLFAYHRTKDDSNPQPTVAYTLARETHDSDLGAGEQTKIQHSFSYSDGFGREIQTKIQAEPGPLDLEDPNTPIVDPRWVGTGWTIFNNKGNPVKQYEPFFSDTHRFEFAMQVGVSPILLYDPIQRVIATLAPNHTYSKVVFDPWQQTTWDVNDTLTLETREDFQADDDVGSYFVGLNEAEYLPTWYSRYSTGTPAEQDSAAKAIVHAGTPSTVHLDILGRPILTIEDNGEFGQYETRVGLDIEGNQLYVIDARGNPVMVNAIVSRDNQGVPLRNAQGNPIIETTAYNLLGHSLYSLSSDAGERWMLNNVAGNPIRGWNSLGYETRLVYDELQRPTHLYVRMTGGPEVLAERTVYGESHPNAIERNLIGQVYQQFDSAGVVTTAEVDFKGNLLRGQRQLTQEYRQQIDWSVIAELTDIEQIATDASGLLELLSVYEVISTYDALNRPTSVTSPDGSEAQPTYNEANLLEAMAVRLRGEGDLIPFVTNIDYNEKGQRTLVEYDNGVRTTYTYDPETFRLTRLFTSRGASFPQDCPNPPDAPCGIQNLHYAYDPVGNITSIRDDAQQTIFYDGQVVSPNTDYVYDALYWLRQANGREHRGQTSNNLPEDLPSAPAVLLHHKRSRWFLACRHHFAPASTMPEADL